MPVRASLGRMGTVAAARRLALVAVAVPLATALAERAAGQEQQSVAPLSPCECLQCFPAAIRYAEGMAEGYGYAVEDLTRDAGNWSSDPAVRQANPDLHDYLVQGLSDLRQAFHQDASDNAPTPAACAEGGAAGNTMVTRLTGDCSISQRESARASLPCYDQYLAVLAHELTHRQQCYDLMPHEYSAIDLARIEAEAYTREADVLRILYQRRWRECARSPQSPRVRFADLPQAVDYLNRALNYEREFPLGGGPGLTP